MPQKLYFLFNTLKTKYKKIYCTVNHLYKKLSTYIKIIIKKLRYLCKQAEASIFKDFI